MIGAAMFAPLPSLGLTAAQWRRVMPEVKEREWREKVTAPFPMSWAGRLLDAWNARSGADHGAANLELLQRCEALQRACAVGVQPDAGDAQIVQAAKDTARDMARRLGYVEQAARVKLAALDAEARERMQMLGLHLEALHWLELRGVADEYMRHAVRDIRAALRRLGCERFWRRVLRKMHARAFEGAARTLGLVHKRAGCYVSNDSVQRRAGQIARNARALESVRAINEHGQDYTLADLAAKGPANREIRRHELMTRIAGFELIAKDCGHAAIFVTVTCPSRMHAYRTAGYGVEKNPRFDGTTPDMAQRHLSGQWAKARAAAKRAGLEWYGFRIAEPNHDGTPHWHCLLFIPQLVAIPGKGAGAGVRGVVARGHADSFPGGSGVRRDDGHGVAVSILRRYFLDACDPHEPGAQTHRVTVEKIDWQRGSAAGYVAKYVAKNIDGYKVEKDLYGNEAMSSSRRVDAWASTWRVRQFQQIGGAPVGVWRELRRLHPDQADAAPVVGLGLDAVNVAAGAKDHETEAVQRYTAANGWATYTELQGGPSVKRKLLRLRVMREASGELGRYGEVMAARAVGVVTLDQRTEVRPAFGIVPARRVSRSVSVGVESERATWIIVPAGSVPAVRAALAGGEAARPWSPVNNCTDPVAAHLAAWYSARPAERVPKRGRWHSWNGGRGSTLKDAHGTLEQDPANAAGGAHDTWAW